MSNHTHVVLHINEQTAQSWTDKDVLRRWHTLHKGMLCTRKYLDPTRRATLSAAEHQTVKNLIPVYRKRLFDISWFMRLLNEYIARQANQEDDCTGRFWEGRFKSQALMDEAALATCMAYVDLNPVRAGIATTPETSAHTSIKQRILCAKRSTTPSGLMPFIGCAALLNGAVLPFRLQDYLALVETTGRQIRPDKRGSSAPVNLHLLQRTGLSLKNWQAMVMAIETRFGNTVCMELALKRLFPVPQTQVG